MGDLVDDAKEIAAKATGLRPDQIERAVLEYRKAIDNLEFNEPKWAMQTHWSYSDGDGDAFCIDPDGATKVTLFIETRKKKQHRTYGFADKGYDTYAEARAVELKNTARPTPYVVAEGPASSKSPQAKK